VRGERLFRPYFGRVDASVALRSFILAELGSAERRWHGLVHHALMLRVVTRAGHDADDTRLLVLATLFHDIVYDATRNDNEEASACVAREWLTGDEAGRVAALVLATKHHHLDTDPVTRTLLEADLAVLWTPSASLYDFYAAGIRAEYAHVPEPAYRAGRTAVLSRLRDQLAAALEAERAHRLCLNLNREIARLSA
jgi:predicted metal-dependent HD superfamily phosphohydrolase